MSAEVALNSSGTATASVLYGPYGTVRYTNGVMPTDYTFTGQRGDTTTGLDDYGARYYDPVVGQFTSADSDARGGLNRYAYVHDDPETFTDPTGRVLDCGTTDCGAGPPPPSPQNQAQTCTSDCGNPKISILPKACRDVGNCADQGPNTTCHLSASKCKKGAAERDAEVSSWTWIRDGLQIAMTIVAILGDFAQLQIDQKNVADGSGDPLDVVLDWLSIAGDAIQAATTIFSVLTDHFHWNVAPLEAGLNAVSSVVNAATAGVKFVQSATGPLAEGAKLVLRAGFLAAVGILNGVDLVGLFFQVGTAVLSAIGLNLSLVAQGVVHLIQAGIDGANAYIDSLNSESIDQYCASHAC